MTKFLEEIDFNIEQVISKLLGGDSPKLRELDSIGELIEQSKQ